MTFLGYIIPGVVAGPLIFFCCCVTVELHKRYWDPLTIRYRPVPSTEPLMSEAGDVYLDGQL